MLQGTAARTGSSAEHPSRLFASSRRAPSRSSDALQLLYLCVASFSPTGGAIAASGKQKALVVPLSSGFHPGGCEVFARLQQWQRRCGKSEPYCGHKNEPLLRGMETFLIYK